MNFCSVYQHGFARVAACTTRIAIADPPANADVVLREARECAEEGAVLDGVEAAVARVVEGSADLLPLIVFGAPLRHRNRIYNCAIVVHRGRVLGVVPKSYLPTYREFYERRQLAPGDAERGEIRIAGADVPF